VRLTFTNPVTINANKLFQANPLFGSKPFASSEQNTVFTLFGDSDNALLPGTQLHLGAAVGPCPAAETIPIPNPSTVPTPIVTILGPRTISPCTEGVAKYTALANNGLGKPLRYSWGSPHAVSTTHELAISIESGLLALEFVHQ
jgi:hypothetical protein